MFNCNVAFVDKKCFSFLLVIEAYTAQERKKENDTGVTEQRKESRKMLHYLCILHNTLFSKIPGNISF